jgi:putative transposase
MARKQRHTAEQAIGKLREAEVKPAEGTAITRVCNDLPVTENAYYRWRRTSGITGGGTSPPPSKEPSRFSHRSRTRPRGVGQFLTTAMTIWTKSFQFIYDKY